MIALVLMALAGCSKPKSEKGDKLVPLLRIHGSNTIGSELAPALAEAFLGKEGAKDIRRVPRAEKVEVAFEAVLPGEDVVSVIEIEAHGSSTSFTALKEDRADIGMSSRRIKRDEAKLLEEELGDMRSRANEHVVALDGLAIIVHDGNRVTTLERDQIQGVFSGRITRWSQVGGADLPIRLYARDDKSGTFESFKSMVLRDEEIFSEAKRFEDSEELSKEVAADAAGIGFIGMPFIGETKALKVFEGSSVPTLPTRLTAGTEDYLFSRRLYLYTATTPENPWIRKFIEFALSDEGQKVVDSVGFVGQALDPERREEEVQETLPAEDLSPRYGQLTRRAERQRFNIFFGSNSFELDNKAHRDVGRLLQLVESSRDEKLEVVLLGFADNQGDPEENLRLSRQRAEAVKNELIAVGIVKPDGTGNRTVIVEGFGEAKLVASNSTEEGRSKNRRVEVWLRR